MLIVVTGLPGSGKTTLRRELAPRLDLPLIAKDRYKEMLFDTLGVLDRAWSRKLGQAAIALQYDAMATLGSAVVDSALWTGVAEPDLMRLGLPLVQVFCECPFDVARERYVARVRHEGFVAEQMTVQDFEWVRPLCAPLKLDAPLIRVDTDRALDIDGLMGELMTYLRPLPEGQGVND